MMRSVNASYGWMCFIANSPPPPSSLSLVFRRPACISVWRPGYTVLFSWPWGVSLVRGGQLLIAEHQFKRSSLSQRIFDFESNPWGLTSAERRRWNDFPNEMRSLEGHRWRGGPELSGFPGSAAEKWKDSAGACACVTPLIICSSSPRASVSDRPLHSLTFLSALLVPLPLSFCLLPSLSLFCCVRRHFAAIYTPPLPLTHTQTHTHTVSSCFFLVALQMRHWKLIAGTTDRLPCFIVGGSTTAPCVSVSVCVRVCVCVCVY